MYSELLKPEDYQSLASLKSVAEIGDKLKEREPYAELMAGETEYHRGFIERKITLSVHDEFSRIYSFITDSQIRNYLDAFFMKNQINFIKSILRSINDERDIKYTMVELSVIAKYLRLDLAPLLLAKTLQDAIEALKGTVFYSQIRTTDESQVSLFNLEMRLDIYYYLHLHSLQNKYLKGDNKKIAEKVNGTEIDMTNISWLYRLKQYYKINNDSLYAYIIPINYRISKAGMAKLVETKSFEEFLAEIEKTPYGRYFTSSKIFEHNFYVVKNAIISKLRILHTESIANTLAYIYFKELEIRNIVSLIEGVRYGLSQDEIMKYIVTHSEKEVIN